MNNKNFKKYFYALAFALTLMTAFGIASPTQAQNRDWNRDRWEDRNRDNRGYYPNGGYDDYRYGNNNRYGRNSEYYKQQEKGYRDGLRRGKEDAQSNRIPDPNNSSHYRKGTEPYREGFRQGFRESYRQYSQYRRRW